ncbi:MAG TPA: hypothetical protein VK716_04960 [Terracidiphilus sp.]|jgi:hypothetical protein|nr:hypothetical protein [Terracidiphilus sp.]
MKFLPRLNLGFWKRAQSGVSAEPILLGQASVSGLDELSKRLSRWGSLWSAENEAEDNSTAQALVTERLTVWLERSFGEHLPASLYGDGDAISLSSSIPILTAFLGRRATRELSRSVLQDI